ncbi:MFS transporter [Lasiodiplodia theobromae]|uniref:MFS transporter n=1 Tax=Lasiodiplodia theobromae TaxID=45133 RepID=UPI0015C3805B|nr:MFS transporter [Lasiodiplodia theobromae]KAF4545339.1 MFS transporter [Lasiodiplodia theobromae]
MVDTARHAAEKFCPKYRHSRLQADINSSGGDGVRYRPSVRMSRAAISRYCSTHILDNLGLRRRCGEEVHQPRNGGSHLLRWTAASEDLAEQRLWYAMNGGVL